MNFVQPPPLPFDQGQIPVGVPVRTAIRSRYGALRSAALWCRALGKVYLVSGILNGIAVAGMGILGAMDREPALVPLFIAIWLIAGITVATFWLTAFVVHWVAAEMIGLAIDVEENTRTLRRP